MEDEIETIDVCRSRVSQRVALAVLHYMYGLPLCLTARTLKSDDTQLKNNAFDDAVTAEHFSPKGRVSAKRPMASISRLCLNLPFGNWIAPCNHF